MEEEVEEEAAEVEEVATVKGEEAVEAMVEEEVVATVVVDKVT